MGPEVALVRPEVNSMVPEITKNAKTRHFSVFMQIFTALRLANYPKQKISENSHSEMTFSAHINLKYIDSHAFRYTECDNIAEMAIL